MDITMTTKSGRYVTNCIVDTNSAFNRMGIGNFIEATRPYTASFTDDVIVLNYHDDTVILLVSSSEPALEGQNRGQLDVTIRDEKAQVRAVLYIVSGNCPPTIGSYSYRALTRGPERRVFLGNIVDN